MKFCPIFQIFSFLTIPEKFLKMQQLAARKKLVPIFLDFFWKIGVFNIARIKKIMI